eukprot:6130125-Pleurochrysis_carterae.AAC.1
MRAHAEAAMRAHAKAAMCAPVLTRVRARVRARARVRVRVRMRACAQALTQPSGERETHAVLGVSSEMGRWTVGRRERGREGGEAKAGEGDRVRKRGGGRET